MTIKERNKIIEEIYVEHHKEVQMRAHAHAKRLYGKDEARCEELADLLEDQSWVSVMRVVEEGGDVKYPKAYLQRAVYNHYLNYLKSTSYKKTMSTDELTEVLLSTLCAPDNLTMSK